MTDFRTIAHYDHYSIKARIPKKYARGKWYHGILCDGHRLDPDTIPEGYHLYHLMHKDNDWTIPVVVKEYVLVNFLGSFLTKEELPLCATEVFGKYLEVQDYCYNMILENQNGI